MPGSQICSLASWSTWQSTASIVVLLELSLAAHESGSIEMIPPVLELMGQAQQQCSRVWIWLLRAQRQKPIDERRTRADPSPLHSFGFWDLAKDPANDQPDSCSNAEEEWAQAVA